MADPATRNGVGVRRLALAAVAFALGLVIALVLGGTPGVSVAAGWGAASLAMLTTIWLRIGRWDAAETEAHARAEDFSRATADTVVLSASLCSLLPVGLTVLEAGRSQGTAKALLIVLAITVVAVSWALVHTVFALRYGDLYYERPTGGIDFGDDAPDYRDFAYVALTIGMTYQVSDTTLTSRALRRAAMRHALMSFLFGAVIVALLINTVGSLLR